MRASTICLVVLSTATTLVSSRPGASYLTQYFWALSILSYKRQSSIPSQCTSTCDPVQTEVNAGCPITACCTQSFETSYYNCLLCVGTAENATDYTQAQTDIDKLYVSCSDYGYSLQELTFPGQNPSRTLSTSSLAGTSTVISTSPASPTPASAPTPTLTPTSALTPTSVSAPTSISKTTILPSSASLASSGTASGTATSSTSTSTTSNAALGLKAGGSGDWALIAAAIGLTVLRNIS